jgi:hypothetical protein
MKRINKGSRTAKMQHISQSELDLLVDHNPIERVHVSATKDGRWVVTFYVKLLSGRTEEYRLLSQRGLPRTWSDLRPMLRFLRDHYEITAGTFNTDDLP